MNFPSIDIQGSILSSDLLGKIRAEQANFQQGKDFNPAFNNQKLKEEISLAWQDAKGQWNIFQNKLKRVKQDDTAATETRSFWILPLLSNFGYDFEYHKAAEELNGKSFWINNRDNNIAGFPLFIAGYNESLDKRPDNKSLRISPHALVQEYLNYSEHLYGLVTNGKQLRLLRDASRITRLSYVEFNLEKIMEEDLYSDFVILYRLLHVSRMPQKQDAGPDSIIEKYHQEGLESGATIRNKLGAAVKDTIKTLANGFVNHPDNSALRQAIADGHFNAEEYYRQQLRIIYRLLFLFVIEERNLVYAESKEEQSKRFNQIYFKYYSLLRLRKLAKHLQPPEAARHYDLWMSLVNTFALFETKAIGEKMGVMSLQGDLFSYQAIETSHYDLHECRLSNAVLMQVVKALSYFETDKKVLIAVNYGGLDVEEFGSVYEGLLELKLVISEIPGTDGYSCNLESKGDRDFQSHYTPEELVQPLIKHSLDYLIQEKLNNAGTLSGVTKLDSQEEALLSIKVCDVACGSGHILLSAARKIAHELACIKETNASGSKEKIEQPSPYYLRKAMRDVIRHCIYGVDKNPLAVELCKVAFWLEAHNPGEPLNFLDHHIKCGDAIVGLAHREELENGIANEAFKTLPGDDKDIASTYRKKNESERKSKSQISTYDLSQVDDNLKGIMKEFSEFTLLPENTPEQITEKEAAYKKLTSGNRWYRLKNLADLQVAQFFISKTQENKDKLTTDEKYRTYLTSGSQILDRGASMAIAQEKRFFHWFLEFPEVFAQGGFDCILGNPPFQGGQKISGANGYNYLECIKTLFSISSSPDLVTFFFLRDFNILNNNGFQSLITTNTISQGKTREAGLENIINIGGTINYAVKSMPWPGLAAVDISLVSIYKGKWNGAKYILNNQTEYISSYLDSTNQISKPYVLKINGGKSFQGSILVGKGFILEREEAEKLLLINSSYSSIIRPYLNGEDINDDPNQQPTRYAINFYDFNESKASKFTDVYQICKDRVKPQRENIKVEKDRDNKPLGIHDQRAIDQWWLYLWPRPELYEAIKNLNSFWVIPRVSKYLNVAKENAGYIYSDATVVIALSSYSDFSILSSNFHECWTRKNASSLETRLRYTPTDCFETYPFPFNIKQVNIIKLENIGKDYHLLRHKITSECLIGLTKMYNLFHSKELINANIKKASKQDDETCKKIHTEILKLRELHQQMDEAVLEAYGWDDIKLKHDFYEVDYLPENDRVRFTIHPDARKEVLKRLLELNHTIYEEEIKQGLHKKEDVEKFYEQKGEAIPQAVLLLMADHKKEKASKAKQKTKTTQSESVYKQPGLFEEDNLFNVGEE